MTATRFALDLGLDLVVIAFLAIGIWQFRTPRGAKFGNLTAACALLCAFVLVLWRSGVVDTATVVISLLIGSVGGYAVARAVSMIQIPAMVALQNGAGGMAAFLVALVELMRRANSLEFVNEFSGVLGLTIGALTFSGSMVAGAKLANKMRQTPQILPAHNWLVVVTLVAMAVIGLWALYAPIQVKLYFLVLQIVLSAVFGILFSIRIGGADMPVLISFLNANTGLAAALCGMVIGNQLLIAFGATVAASGSILTHLMCKAMNRNLLRIFVPDTIQQKAVTEGRTKPPAVSQPDPLLAPADIQAATDQKLEKALAILADAKKIIIVPGYGMALAQGQLELVALAKKMVEMGKEVRYAIHPVAGRMPGHMNVLLAEAGVDYDLLVEMEEINPEFQATDLVLIVGACDVVNPAAITVAGTPITGMPILLTHEAKHVICCNYDDQPGYSGVKNPLYEKSHTVLLTGDAKETLHRLLEAMTAEKPVVEKPPAAVAIDGVAAAVNALASAKTVVIIPGYGMALAQAQFKVVELAAMLEKRGATVKFAIHPVAGRMPGHMNVILAEAEVDYENLLEMDTVNPQFGETDVALIFGACDVVNPAAIDVPGTPISGMPILMAHVAKTVIVCNFDTKPGYSGVANPLYDNPKSILLLGDAKKSASQLIAALESLHT
ncbi:MAG: NAD(P)(+) transhydrogenase (Re/Si-specific) subunit beta [Desulfobacterales bacterium]